MNFKTGEIFAIDKPYGITSFKALAHVRYVLSHTLGHRVKIGHAGTLDPLATGVLILCTGKCTKQIETLQAHTKEYEATLQLGATTPSYDMEHEVNETFATAHITEDAIREALPQFVGDIQQTPPTFSACKIDGKRAFDVVFVKILVGDFVHRNVVFYKRNDVFGKSRNIVVFIVFSH